jgi:hypothetical protein
MAGVGGSSVRSGSRMPRAPVRSDTLRSEGYGVDAEPRIFPGVVSRQRTNSIKAGASEGRGKERGNEEASGAGEE